MSLRDQACGFAAAPVEQGSHPQPHSAKKQKGPARGPFDFLAERVGLTRPFRPRPSGACGVQNANAFCRTHGFELHKSCGNKKASSRGLLLLLAERVGWALRAAEGDCVAARLEQGSNPHPTRQKCKRPQKGPLTFWRRGWDSNPRYGRTAHLISNQAHSTTLAPLLNFASQSCRRPADVGTPDLTRHRWWPALRAASPFKIAPGDFVDHYPSTRLPFSGAADCTQWLSS